ncbi:hypothetical protein [Gudongella sp. SC589]|uniref:hypothetical protein n=1 Tax=Gudongella sp. SC589 TaxID=3385990 RepID=UPI0039046FDF
MKKKWLSIIFWGSIWGIAEATLGHVLHMVSMALPGLPGFVMFPVAFFFMRKVYLENRKPQAVFYAAAIAAGIKLVDFLVPGSIPLRIVNPAISILMEGLAVAMVFAYVNSRDKKFGFMESFFSGLLWRGMWVVYLVAISLFNLPAELVTSGPLIALRFLIMESLVNAALIFVQLKFISPVGSTNRRPVFVYGAFLIALLLQIVF